MITEPYIRKKGDKFIIEQKIEGKTKYLKTLPDAKSLLNILNGLASKEKDVKASQNVPKIESNNTQNFAQSLLTAPLNKDASEDDLISEAKKVQNKIMRELLG